jgi:hypothetical protein
LIKSSKNPKSMKLWNPTFADETRKDGAPQEDNRANTIYIQQDTLSRASWKNIRRGGGHGAVGPGVTGRGLVYSVS